MKKDLREKAREILSRKGINADIIKNKDVSKLIEELNIYHIELEHQNDELLETQIKLEENNKKYSRLYNTVPIGLVTLNKDFEIIEMNQRFMWMMNLNRNNLIGKPLHKYIHPDCQDEFYLKFNEIIRKKESASCEIALVPKNMVFFNARMNCSFEKNSDTVNISIEDITRQKQIEKELKENEEFVRGVVNTTSNLIYIYDLVEKKNIYSNQRHKHFFRKENPRDSGTLSYYEISELAHPDDFKELLEKISIFIEERETDLFFHDIRLRQGGKYIWMNLSISVFKENEDGEITQLIGSLSNIDVRKKATEALAESENRFKNLFNSSLSGVFYADVEGNILEVNNKMVEILGSPSPEDTKKINVMTFPPLIEMGYAKNIKKAIKEKKVVRGDGHYKSKWGKEIFVEYYFSPIIKDNKVAGVLANVDDVTELREAQSKLKESEERLYLALKGNSEGVWDWDLQTNELYLSEQWKQMLGYEDHELENSFATFEKLILPDDLENALNHLNDYIEGKSEKYHIEFRMKHKDGHLVDILARGVALWDDKENKPYRVVGTHYDISRRKQVEREIASKNEELKTQNQEIIETNRRLVDLTVEIEAERNKAQKYLDISGVLFIALDTKGNVTLANKKAVEVLGYPENEIVGKNWFKNFLPKENINEVKEVFNNIIANKLKGFEEIEGIIVTKDKDERVVKWHNTVLFDENKNVTGLLSAGEDITEFKKYEKELVKLNHAIEQSTSTIVITDKNGDIIYANPQFEKSTGYTMDEAIGQNPRLLKSGIQPEVLYKGLWETISAGKNWTGELQNKRKNGELYWESAMISPVKNQEGKIENYIAIKYDITHEKEYKEQLKESFERSKIREAELEELNKTKDKLFSIIGHDLKNPIFRVLGFAELLIDDYKTLKEEEIRQYHQIMYDSTKSISSILDNLLNWSRLQREKISIVPRDLKLRLVISGVTDFLSLSAKEKQISVYNNVPDEFLVSADEEMLSTIFRNLIQNALKFTNKFGEVTIKAEEKEDFIEVRIKDTGIGMPDEMIKKLFSEGESFSRKGTNDEKGSGLGLMITKEFLDLIEGRIDVESEEGKGTTFILGLKKPTYD